jgi:hypothetical protein
MNARFIDASLYSSSDLFVCNSPLFKAFFNGSQKYMFRCYGGSSVNIWQHKLPTPYIFFPSASYIPRRIPFLEVEPYRLTTLKYKGAINDCGDKNIQTWNNLKTPGKLMKFIWRCSTCAPLVTLQMSKENSNSSHRRHNCNPSTFATPSEIPFLMDCDVGGRYTWSFIYFYG